MSDRVDDLYEEAEECVVRYHDILRRAEEIPFPVTPLLEEVWRLAQREASCRRQAEKMWNNESKGW